MDTGAGFIPAIYAIDSPDITYFSLEPKLYRIHAIIYRKDLELTPPFRYLIQLAQNYVKGGLLGNPFEEHFI